MYKYKDLIFAEHDMAKNFKSLGKTLQKFFTGYEGAGHARMTFDNGWGISVVRDCPAISGDWKFEVAIFDKKGDIVDIDRCGTKQEVSEIMEEIQKRI